MASLGELFIELGVLGDDEGAKKVAKAIDEAIDKAKEYAKQQKQQEKQEQNNAKSSGNLAKNIKNVAAGLGGVITAVSGAVIALNKLAESLVQQNQQWINLTRNSDIALSTFQKWGQVGAAMNASLGEMGAAGALADLNERLFEMKLTGQGYEGFALAGIMPTNAEDVMEQLRSRIKGLNDTSATYLLKRMGIDPRMLSVLRMTREEFNSLTKELEKYQLTMEQRQQIQEFHKQMSIVNVKMQYFKDRILIALLPHIERIMKFVVKLIELLPKYRGILVGLGIAMTKGFGKWLKTIPLIGKHLKPIIKILQTMRIFGKSLFKGLNGFITKIPVIGRLFGALGKIISKVFFPLTLAYLIIDDIMGYFEGKDSAFGAVINYLQDMGQDWLNIGKIFTTKPLLAFKAALIKIGDIFIRIAQIILNTVDWVLGTKFGKWLSKVYGGDDYNDNMKEFSENLRQAAAELDAERTNTENLAKNTVPSNVYNNNGGNNNSKNVNITQNNNITTTQPAQTIYNDLGMTYQAALFG